jgi:DNA-binding IclR family transcriptional regulator
MVKIKKPTDLLLKENALKLLWELYQLSLTEKPSSIYQIAKKTGLGSNTVSSYLKRWSKHGLILVAKDKENTVFGLDPRVIDFDSRSVSFKMNGLKIRVTPSPLK